MTDSSFSDRFFGFESTAAIKQPCRCASTANIPFVGSAPYGFQTIDGVAVSDNASTPGAQPDRVLLKNQADGTQNGIWIVQSTAWLRAPDFDGQRDVVTGTQVLITGGGASGGKTFQLSTTTNPIIIGTTSLVFVQITVPGSGIVGIFNVLTYGATGNGSTDDTAAINACSLAASGGGGFVYFPPGTYNVTAAINLYSDVIYYGAGPLSIISGSVANLDQMYGTGISGAIVRDLKIVNVPANTGVGVAGIHLLTATNCKVLNCEFSGQGDHGVRLEVSNLCEIRGNYFHNFNLTNNVQDSADIAVLHDCYDNVVDGNFCYGGSWHGILIQGNLIAAGHNPLRNVVTNNRVGAHSAYGIICYNVNSEEQFTIIEGNDVRDITGLNPSGTGGAGIYIAGAGGCIIANNNVRNCCVSTSVYTLAPAGIGVNGVISTLSPITITGNTVKDIVNYNGIYVVSSACPVTICGNTISLLNNVSVNTVGVYLHNASNCTVSGNVLALKTASSTVGILLYADGANTSGTTISGNIISGCDADGVRADQNGGFVNNSVCVANNTAIGGSASCNPFHLYSISDGTITGNVGNATTAQALVLNNVLRVRIANNSFISSGSTAVLTAGTCTGSYFDKTNYFGTAGSMNNGATGLIVEFLSAVIPATGTWAVGDRAEMSVPVVGQPKGWRCTVAGAAGTWVSEGNL